MEQKQLTCDEFIQRVVTKEMYWMSDATDELRLDVGTACNCSPSYKYLTLSSDNAHGYVHAAPGAGLSNFLTSTLLTAMFRYAPSELSVYLLDAEGGNTEAFVDTESDIANYPHFKYIHNIASVGHFFYLMREVKNEVNRRYKLLRTFSCDTFPELRRRVCEAHMGEVVLKAEAGSWRQMVLSKQWVDTSLNVVGNLPRMLVVFNRIDKLLDDQNINSETRKEMLDALTHVLMVGPQLGIHCLFFSQDPRPLAGEMYKTYCDLRICGRCREDVSQALMDTEIAATIKEKYGFFYSIDCNKNTPCLWSTPCADVNSVNSLSSEMFYLLQAFAEDKEMAVLNK